MKHEEELRGQRRDRQGRSTIDRYLDAFEAGTLREQQCGRRIEALTAKLVELKTRQEELRDLLVTAHDPTPDPQELAELLERVRAAVQYGRLPVRKTLVDALVEEIRVRSCDHIVPLVNGPTIRLVAPRTTMALKLTTGHLVSERPGAVRLPRQVAAATVLQADPKHRAACGAARCDRLLDPALLHPERNLTPTKQHRPRGLIAPGRRHNSAPRPDTARGHSRGLRPQAGQRRYQAPLTRSASGRSRARGRTAAQLRCVSSTGQWESRSEGD